MENEMTDKKFDGFVHCYHVWMTFFFGGVGGEGK